MPIPFLRGIFQRGKPSIEKTLQAVKSKIPTAIALGTVGVVASQTDEALRALKGLFGDVKYKSTVEKRLDRLIELQPALARFDRDKLRLYYEQLRHFAPDVATNDLAAASYIKFAIQYHDSGMPIATYETLAKTQKQMHDIGPKPARGILGSSLMASTAFGGTNEEAQKLNFKPFFPDSGGL